MKLESLNFKIYLGRDIFNDPLHSYLFFILNFDIKDLTSYEL